MNIRIRLHGIDAPELNEPYGPQAKFSLQQIINQSGGNYL